MRTPRRLDSNHAQIVQALRKSGLSVQSLASLGHGVPDALVASPSRMWLFEIKDGSKPPSQRKLTEDEIKWHKLWPYPVHIVESVEQALQACGKI